ncbi:hypothetical protein V6Z11_D04G099400 [Gossypium hirsutum]
MCQRSIVNGFTSKELYDAPPFPDTAKQNLVSFSLAIEEEVDVEEEDVHVEVVNEKGQKENSETEATEKESVKDIVNAFEFMGASIDNLERDGSKLVKAAKVTSEEHHSSLAIVVYTGPLKVTFTTHETTGDAREVPKTKERSKDRAKPKEKKRNRSKDKKYKKEEKKKRKKKHRATTLMAKEN